MFETSGTLTTYRLDVPPEQLLTNSAHAEKISDHSLKFLTYQGDVNQGQATVEIVDQGTYQLISSDKEHQKMQITGEILTGTFELRHIEQNKWQFIRI